MVDNTLRGSVPSVPSCRLEGHELLRAIPSRKTDSQRACRFRGHGTQVTIRGWVVVEPRAASNTLELQTLAGGRKGTVRVVKG